MKVEPRKDTNFEARGFTLMEIVVATTIFAVVVSSLLALFNYTLKINRRAEALRQASQGIRNFIELLGKEIRNGQIDYGVISGQTRNTNAFYTAGPCSAPVVGAGNPPAVSDSYSSQSNLLAIQTAEGDYECFYMAFGKDNTAGQNLGDYVGNGVLTSSQSNPHPVLAMKKNTLPVEILTPPNLSVQNLTFYIRPLCDPYAPGCTSTGGYPKKQPLVGIVGKFLVSLPTGEQTTIYYQTSISGNKYDVPN